MLGDYAACIACGDCVAICEPRALEVSRGRYGMLAACAGGGMGGAMIVERL